MTLALYLARNAKKTPALLAPITIGAHFGDMRILAILITLAVPSVAVADGPIGAFEFDARTTGKTIYYGLGGSEYGAEQYLEGRRVLWSFLDGECRAGVWWPQGQDICFSYEGFETVQCWQFFDTPSGLRAEFQQTGGGDSETEGPYQMRSTEEPLYCLGPKVGT